MGCRLQRLHAKDFLKRRKVGKLHQYSSTEQRSTVMSRLIGQFLDKVLDGSPTPFVTYLTEKENLSDSQVAVLQKIARELERKEGETS